jgi:hypothetical protein
MASFSKSEQARIDFRIPASVKANLLEAPSYESGGDLGAFLIAARGFCPTALDFQLKMAPGRTNIGTNTFVYSDSGGIAQPGRYRWGAGATVRVVRRHGVGAAILRAVSSATPRGSLRVMWRRVAGGL